MPLPAGDAVAQAGDADLRVLIATDVLSEGQNLQDAHVVVNFDLPWAIIRLIQRAGRVDRIGQKHDTILAYSFLPAEEVDRIIRLRTRLMHRLEQDQEVIGTDESFFSEQAKQKLHDLYTEKRILDDDADEEVDLVSFAQQVWNSAAPADRKAALALPPVVPAARPVVPGFQPASPDGILPPGSRPGQTRSADFQSAVSPTSSRPGGAQETTASGLETRDTADSKSALHGFDPLVGHLPAAAKGAPSRKAPSPRRSAGALHDPPGLVAYLRYPDGADALVRVDDSGRVLSQSLSAIFRSAACGPDTPALPLAQNLFDLLAACVRAAHEEQVSLSGQLGSLRSTRRKLYERLRNYRERLKKNPDLFARDTLQRLDPILSTLLRSPLKEAANDSLRRQMRLGISDEELAENLCRLHGEDRLCQPVEIKEDALEPQILCSLGIQGV